MPSKCTNIWPCRVFPASSLSIPTLLGVGRVEIHHRVFRSALKIETLTLSRPSLSSPGHSFLVTTFSLTFLMNSEVLPSTRLWYTPLSGFPSLYCSVPVGLVWVPKEKHPPPAQHRSQRTTAASLFLDWCGLEKHKLRNCSHLHGSGGKGW